MKVYIVSDMEGVAGIVEWQQVTGGDPMYEEGAGCTPGEINAAVRGAKAAGGDGDRRHGLPRRGRRLVVQLALSPEELDPACEFVVQSEWTEYTAYLEERCPTLRSSSGCTRWPGTRDGVLFAHRERCRRGGAAPLLRGREVGETGILAALCGAWGCPVLLVTGDEAVRPRGRCAAGTGPDDCRGQAGARPLQCATAARCPCARPDRGCSERLALADSKAVRTI